MNIDGLDYNTQREKLVLPEYGREVQNMVDYAISLDDKADRQRCAETIILTMERMLPQVREGENYKQKLWDQLALMSDLLTGLLTFRKPVPSKRSPSLWLIPCHIFL